MQVRATYKLQNCSGHFRMSSSLKDLQCIAVCTEEDCSETKSVMPLTHRIGRLQNHHIFLPTDEPCWQSCAARGRPRLSYREHHWIAPVRLTAAQPGPWLRPATYRPSQIDTTNHAEPPDKGHPVQTQMRQTNSGRNLPRRRAKQRKRDKNRGPRGRQKSPVLSHLSENCCFLATQTITTIN